MKDTAVLTFDDSHDCDVMIVTVLALMLMKIRCGTVAPLVPLIGCFSAQDTSLNLTFPGTYHCIVKVFMAIFKLTVV